MPYKAVIFDFNGVLANDEHLHFELMQTLVAIFRVVLSEEDYFSKVIGFDDREAFKYVLGDQIDEKKLQSLIDQKNQMYLEAIASQNLLFPGVLDVVPQVAAGHLCAINSGALRVEIEAILKKDHLQSHFKTIVSTDDLKHSKPHPEGYLLAFEKLQQFDPNLKKQDCVVLEDTLAGVASAKAAGLAVVGIANSVTVAELKVCKADFVIQRIEELLAILNP
jgi:HAD superfamily hydrolase (TIGR01509 family)